ncbi:hypothetical protein COLO4_00454 [Corchorus olitorius]|uniref:Uncharacterized protein n=1 Tax=Corchorus olitorius TaxID=93759 RepID=A0A1R3L3T6_9ROSI|nr:hypothetical protein COLO4_00454 [Corchorus olitorius]
MTHSLQKELSLIPVFGKCLPSLVPVNPGDVALGRTMGISIPSSFNVPLSLRSYGFWGRLFNRILGRVLGYILQYFNESSLTLKMGSNYQLEDSAILTVRRCSVEVCIHIVFEVID